MSNEHVDMEKMIQANGKLAEIICLIPLSKLEQFKKELFEELTKDGKKEVTEAEFEAAIRVVSDRWERQEKG